MIKGWKRFFESNQTVKTEIIQEVIYFGLFIFDGDIKDLESLWDILRDLLQNHDIDPGIYYDISMDELNNLIQKIEEICRKDEKEYEKIVNLYDIIRKDPRFSKKPRIYQIEDAILSFIENEKFFFSLHVYGHEKSTLEPIQYLLRLSSKYGTEHTPEQFIEIFKKIQMVVKKLKFPGCPNPFLQKIQLYNYQRGKNSIDAEILI